MFKKFEKLKAELTIANEQIEELKLAKIRSEELYVQDELRKLVMDRINTSHLLREIQDQFDQIAGKNKKKDVLLPFKEASERIDAFITNKSWDQAFEALFEKAHGNFVTRLKAQYPELSRKDCRLCQFILMGLSTKEISSLMNITVRGAEVSRFRLRKKLSLDKDTSLAKYFSSF